MWSRERSQTVAWVEGIGGAKNSPIARIGKAAQSADLGIATQTDARIDLVTTPLYEDDFIAVMTPDHTLATRRSLEWAQVAREPIIGYLPGNPVRTLREHKLAERGLRLQDAFEIALPWAMMGLAREGLGVAVVTMALRPLAEWHGLQVRSVGRPAFARTMVLLRSPGQSPSSLVAAFSELLLGSAAALREDAKG